MDWGLFLIWGVIIAVGLLLLFGLGGKEPTGGRLGSVFSSCKECSGVGNDRGLRLFFIVVAQYQ